MFCFKWNFGTLQNLPCVAKWTRQICKFANCVEFKFHYFRGCSSECLQFLKQLFFSGRSRILLKFLVDVIDHHLRRSCFTTSGTKPFYDNSVQEGPFTNIMIYLWVYHGASFLIVASSCKQLLLFSIFLQSYMLKYIILHETFFKHDGLGCGCRCMIAHRLGNCWCN